LGLLAYELAGGQAGAVLGTALAIKMIAYVSVAPIAGAVADRLPRRAFLVAMDLVRAVVALLLPFVGEVWQVYVLIFVLQACSAAFTPTFQATIPDILPDEALYTRALSLSRLAYDLENLLSPTIAAAFLTVVSFHWLFSGDALSFLASAALVLSVRLPQPKRAKREGGVYEKTTHGLRLYLETLRLRGLLALNLAVAAAGAMVIVNTVVYVKARLGLGDTEVAIALAASGAGSMLVALALPRVLDRLTDRPVMLAGAALLALGLVLGLTGPGYLALLPIWFVLGMGSSAVQTPSGRLLRRSAHPPDRPALFAAQFALSHACWLLTYPLAGWLGAKVSLTAAFAVLAILVGVGLVLAFVLWPAEDPDVIEHVHEDLPPGHPHLRDARPAPEGPKHAHAYIIDEHHRHWPA
jgi:MFS family permease